MTKRANNEDLLQEKCYKYFLDTYFSKGFILFAVPNGEYRDDKTASKLVSLGVLAGVSDLIAVNPMSGQAVFIELKAKKGTQKPLQKVFEAKCKLNNAPYHLINNFDDFKKIIDELFVFSNDHFNKIVDKINHEPKEIENDLPY